MDQISDNAQSPLQGINAARFFDELVKGGHGHSPFAPCGVWVKTR